MCTPSRGLLPPLSPSCVFRPLFPPLSICAYLYWAEPEEEEAEAEAAARNEFHIICVLAQLTDMWAMVRCQALGDGRHGD